MQENQKLSNNDVLQERDLKRLKSYYKFLVEEGANKEILNMPYIRELIINIILNGDPRLKAEGKSPIAYLSPNDDGTFDIGARLNGPTISSLYKMNYCNDENPEHYLSLTINSKETVSYSIDGPNPLGESYEMLEKTIIYINSKGEKVETITEKKDNIKGRSR